MEIVDKAEGAVKPRGVAKPVNGRRVEMKFTSLALHLEVKRETHRRFAHFLVQKHVPVLEEVVTSDQASGILKKGCLKWHFTRPQRSE